jgi:hypothetical protein
MLHKKKPWEQVGDIGVDAGLCWVGDPCYIMGKDASSHPCEKWGDFVDQLYPAEAMENDGDGHLNHPFDQKGFKQFNFSKGHSGLGVVVSTGYGDGFYPVFVRRNSEGRVVEVKVVFDGPELLEEGYDE